MKIILCVTGSIAAIESIKLARELKREGYDVECFMTEHATDIITPYTMEFATGKPVVTKLTGKIEHVKNAQADLIIVAPATANTISKFAYKIADNPVSTLLITANGYKTPILFVPSMHKSMYKAIQENVTKIKNENNEIRFMEPKDEENKSKFPSKKDITLVAERMTLGKKLEGMNVLINTGATFEPMDAMRGITNRSSGKMGVELAKEAYRQGANVTLVCGKIHVHIPKVFKRIDTETTQEMMDVISKEIINSDIYISAAAVSDFKIGGVIEDKYSSDENISIEFTKLPKILAQIKDLNPDVFLVGFKAEAGLTEDKLIEKSRNRMEKYDADLMIANDILKEDAGPGSDNNEVILLYDNQSEKISFNTKQYISKEIIDRISRLV